MTTAGQAPDTCLQRSVLGALERDVRLVAGGVAVRVQGGGVILEGVVESWTLRATVLETAQRLAHGAPITNHVRVRLPGAARRDDGDIYRAVLETLGWHGLGPDLPVVTSVSNGWVALQGSVASASQRRDAEQAVKCLSNVRGVTNELEVTPPVLDKAKRRPPPPRASLGSLAAR